MRVAVLVTARSSQRFDVAVHLYPASLEKGSERLRDGIQIGPSPAVEEVALEVIDRVRLERTLQLLVDHGLIGGQRTPERLGKHKPQGPRWRHAEQRCVPDEERPEV